MTAPAEPLLRHFHRLVSSVDAEPASDAALLERFIRQRDEGAFAALVRRHGPMVLGVCRRVLHDRHEAEDAFQATFLILARKAGSLRRPQSLAAWLYGTARRLALTSRRAKSRRLRREVYGRDSLPPAQGDPLDELRARELLRVLEEEMARLPEAYRLPMILCGLEGRSREEAARLLGWSAGSVKGRLEHGRARLRARLRQRGWVLSTVLLPAAMTPSRDARVPADLIDKAVQASRRFVGGIREGIAAEVWTLAQTGIQGMTAKVKMTLVLALTLCVLAAGAGMMAWPAPGVEREARASQPAEPAERPRPDAGKPSPRTDLYGDPLPSGAIARLGTVRFRHGGWLTDVLVSPDGRTVISVGSDAIEMWDARSGRRRRRITSSSPSFCGIDLSPDGKLLAVANSPNPMRFWNLASGAEVHPFGDAAPVAFRVAFSPDRKWLATRDAKVNQDTISIWDVRAGKKIRTIEAGGVWMLRLLAFSPNSKLLAFPADVGVRVWDVAADKELHRLHLGTKTPVGCVAFSSDGKLLAAAADPYKRGADHAIHLWDAATGKEVGALKGHEGNVVDVAMSPKDNLLASSSWDGTIRFWDLETQKELGQCPGPRRKSYLTHLAFTADGKVLVSGESIGIIRLWDARTRQEIATPAVGANCVEWAAFAPDGQTLITTVKEQLGLWEPFTGRPRRILHSKFPDHFHPALSPDGKRLATVDWTGGQALLWDVATGKLVRRFGEGGPRGSVSSCTFSPDSRRLAGGSYQQDIIRVWDVASGKEVQQLKGQHMPGSLAFAPDGTTLASASAEAGGDYTARLWELSTGKEIWRKRTDPWTAFELCFSPDGRTLALVGASQAGRTQLARFAYGKRRRARNCTVARATANALAAWRSLLMAERWPPAVWTTRSACGKSPQDASGSAFRAIKVSFRPSPFLPMAASSPRLARILPLSSGI